MNFVRDLQIRLQSLETHIRLLDMAVFDALRHLSNYLSEAHTQGRHHLADLYELVQYAGNIVPRLYLMITVGSVYMSISDSPVKEIMKDMMEMSRGVLHPIRGLFLRHYLSGQTRDHLPVGNDPGYVYFHPYLRYYSYIVVLEGTFMTLSRLFSQTSSR